jgi:uncharacterized phage protein (TIGR01671 family)
MSFEFRAWNEWQDGNSMVYFKLDETKIIEDLSVNARIMQDTGFKDKNGEKIYTGDIVKYTFDMPGSPVATENGLKIRLGEVFWSDFRGSYSVCNYKNVKAVNNDLFKYIRNGNTVEIVGNIYENPECWEE